MAIWIYTVCKGRVYPGSAGQGLIILSGIANNVDPDQTAPSGAVLSESALFAYATL